MTMKGLLGATSALIALTSGAVFSSEAFAQEEETAGGVEDIVVVAQRRGEALQDVPIAIEVVSGERAEALGVVSPQTLSVAVPSLQFNMQSNGSVVYLRGVGSPSGISGNEPSVAIYIDDVYLSSPGSSNFQFNNIESIEVLKGPQGTLFGRNASGGVILLRTRNPGAEPEAEFRGTVENYGATSLAFYGSTPLSDNLAANLSLYQRDQPDGWGVNTTTGNDTFTASAWGARAKLLWTPSASTEILLSADITHGVDQLGNSIHLVPGALGVDGASRYNGFYNAQSTFDDRSEITQSGGSVRVQHEFDFGTLVSVTAYRNLDLFVGLDQDVVAANIALSAISSSGDTYSQELQLLSPEGSSFDWILGAYYWDDTSAIDPVRNSGTSLPTVQYRDTFAEQHTRSYAVFGQATFDLTDQTRFTGGLRYTSDTRDVEGHLENMSLGGVLTRSAFAEQTNEAAEWTWRLALDHDFTPNIMGYVSYNRGFKSGVFNLNSYSLPAVNPEILDAYEIGLKTLSFDNRVRLNLAAFHYSYQDIQVQSILSGAVITVNAAEASIDGVDASFDIAVTDELTLSGGASYLDGVYDDFQNAPFFTPNPGGGNTRFVGDATGLSTTRTPKFTANVTADYWRPAWGGEAGGTLSLSYNDGFYWDPDHVLREPVHYMLAASVGWRAPDDVWTATLWGRNLLDEEVCTYATMAATRAGCSPAAPMTYGLTLSRRF